MSSRIQVLVVDDSAFMRKVITDILNSSGDIEVAGTAKNGLDALEKAKTLNVDVITLDVQMPVMDGLSCLKRLAKLDFIPVIMLSNLTKEGERATIEALENGAIDFIAKPTNIFGIGGDEKKNEIIEKVRMAYRISKARGKSLRRTVRSIPVSARTDMGEYKLKERSGLRAIVAIGASTGGPKSLQEVISGIPGDIPAAFLITQHMPQGFTKSLADRLNSLSELTVKEAEDDELVLSGYAYIAPGDYHLTIVKSGDDEIRIKLSQSPPVWGHRPSVDVMMESVSETGFPKVVGVIMTGMGRDGSEGIKKLKLNNNGYIIAQDKKTCIVYGMPKAAVETGVVDIIVPLEDLSGEIKRIVGVVE